MKVKMMMNEFESRRTSEEILETTRQKVRYLESILGKAKELTPQQQDEFETKFHNSVRMKKWVE
jgi:ABC-type transporter MlaC component